MESKLVLGAVFVTGLICGGLFPHALAATPNHSSSTVGRYFPVIVPAGTLYIVDTTTGDVSLPRPASVRD